jgi:hypothetical protein
MPDDAGAEPATTPPGEAATDTPDDASDDESTSTAGQVAESAAEIALGAVIGPFTGGETVTMVESIRETVEEGVDRLTHLGHHHDAAPEGDADSPRDPASATGEDLDVPADDGRD